MKLSDKAAINRLVIYFFYDADGIVDRYVPYMLEDVKKNCAELFVVCNGKLTPQGRSILSGITPHVLVRENEGFDVWAYKTALEHYGWEKLGQYDEVVLMNHTIMGPVYPFSEMFSEMNGRDLDFWGITAYHEVPFDPFGTICYGYIPWHLQSSFIAVRNPMLTSMEFHDYWASRPPITSYNEAVGVHEAIFTKRFQDMGFVGESYVDTSDLTKYTENPLMKCPLELIRDRKCPIFKRRSFFHSYAYFLSDLDGDQSRQLLEYVDKKTDYDADLIWENIIRTSNLASIKTLLHLNYILPERQTVKPMPDCKVALVIHSYFDDLIEYCYRYSLSMPATARVIVTTDSEGKAEKIREVFSKLPHKDVQVVLAENRGRDVSALLVAAAPLIRDMDLVCFVHDKKVTQIPRQSVGRSFSERCFQNCLATPEYVQNVISTMMDNRRLGLLCPPPPNFSDYYPTTGVEWGPNFENVKKLADELGIKAVIEQDKEPVAPLGTMFWFKPDALKPLFDHKWKYTDFPKEPNGTDGTILHAIERLYPFAAQSQGYCAGWCMTIPQAQLEWNNLNYMLREINVSLFKVFGPQSHRNLLYLMEQSRSNGTPGKPLKRIEFKNKMKAKIPAPIWRVMKKTYHIFGGKAWIG